VIDLTFVKWALFTLSEGEPFERILRDFFPTPFYSPTAQPELRRVFLSAQNFLLL